MRRIRIILAFNGIFALGACTDTAGRQEADAYANQRIQQILQQEQGGEQASTMQNTGTGKFGASWKTSMQEIIASYFSWPLHKALFLDTKDGFVYSGYPGGKYKDENGEHMIGSQLEMQKAIDITRAECEYSSAQRPDGDPSRCVPIYVDEQQLLDWTIYAGS
jgi:hypothetical protein